MGFYYYKEEPEVIATYGAPTKDLFTFLESRVSDLRTVGFFSYLLNSLINGRAFPNKNTLATITDIVAVNTKIENDYNWASKNGMMVEIRICNHIEERFGISVFLCMKHIDDEEQGWIMLEQVLIKRSNGRYSWWCYSEE